MLFIYFVHNFFSGPRIRMIDQEFSLDTLYTVYIIDSFIFESLADLVLFKEVFQNDSGPPKILLFHSVLPEDETPSQLSSNTVNPKITWRPVRSLPLNILSVGILDHDSAHFPEVLPLSQVAYLLHIIPNLLDVFEQNGLDHPKCTINLQFPLGNKFIKFF